MAQRLEEARQQQESLELLGARLLPDGRSLKDADPDGSLLDVLQALQPVVRRYADFHLDLTTREGLRLGLLNKDGALAVEAVVEDRSQKDIDLEAAEAAGGTDPPAPSTIQLTDDDNSALTALLRNRSSVASDSERSP